MNYEKALKILDIKENYDYKLLKNKYYIKALKYHPDKNIDINSKETFQEISEAYNYLKKYNNHNKDYKYEYIEHNYNDILYKFILSLNQDLILDENDVELFNNIFDNDNIIYLLKLLKLLPRDKINRIYEYLINIKFIKHTNIIKEIEKILKENTKEEIKYIINPSIDNLLNDEIFKIILDNQEYLVPLWHNEIVYDNSNSRIIFECIPEISNNIFINDDNNIFINVSSELHCLIEKEIFEISIGSKKYNIDIDDIKIKKNQIITIKNSGISKIDYKNIYNIENKSNIYINLELY